MYNGGYCDSKEQQEEFMKFEVIYCDAPWHYDIYIKANRSIINHYELMSSDDIYNLDVASISADDCILFMWVTFPKLLEGIKAIESWGFTYKTNGFTWVKKNKIKDSWFWGLGFWTRANAEVCLIATKGKPKRVSKAVHSIIDTPIEKHSKKPDIVRDKIVELVGDLPRVELFAREKQQGWVCLGNEIDNNDIRVSIDMLSKIKQEELMTKEQEEDIEKLFLTGATIEEVKAYIWDLTIKTLNENSLNEIKESLNPRGDAVNE